MYFLFYQIFGLESEVLRICNYLHIFRRLGEMLFTSSWHEHMWKMQNILHYCYVRSYCLSFPSCSVCCLAVEQCINILYYVKVKVVIKKRQTLLEEHRGGKESEQWFSRIFKELMILFALELVFYPGENQV